MSGAPWHAHLALISVKRARARLEQLRRAGALDELPTLWQVELGVLRMWHRVLFRSHTIGTCAAHPVRSTRRARLLSWRALRLPCLLWERAIAPWDMSGLGLSNGRLRRHLLGAHHDSTQFVYDLQLLAGEPGLLEALEEEARSVVEGRHPRGEWLRDLCVYEGYHEALLAGLERFRRGAEELADGDEEDPDVSLYAYLRWCRRQPASPRETWRALRGGRFTVSRGILA